MSAQDIIARIAKAELADPATDDLTVPLAIELAEAREEIARHKARGDNHWETLRGIRDLARAGDCEAIIQWVNDAGSGYVETAETTIAKLQAEIARLKAEGRS